MAAEPMTLAEILELERRAAIEAAQVRKEMDVHQTADTRARSTWRRGGSPSRAGRSLK